MGTFQFTERFGSDSSVIDQVHYDSVTGTMIVELHNGTLAGYSQVSPIAYERFKDADSHGQHWNRFIKGQYAGMSTEDFNSFVPRNNVLPAKSAVADEATEYVVVVQVSGRVNQPYKAVDAETAMREVKERFVALGLDVKVVSVNERD